MVHQPVSRGLAVFADAWLSGWLACGDQRRLTGNGSALEVVPRRCAIQMHDFTYFTLLIDTFFLRDTTQLHYIEDSEPVVDGSSNRRCAVQ